MRSTSIAAVALVAGFVGIGAAHASLLGDTVDGAFYFPDTSTLYDDEGNAAVSPSASFEFATGIPNTYATVTADQVTVTFDADGIYAPADFDGVVITDITSSDISGVSVDAATTVAGFTSSELSFTSDSISINLADFSVGADDQVVVDVATGVPEPFSLSLLAAGLIGLGATRRRKAV